MNNKIENFQELIDKAKEMSKKKFLKFAKDIYDIDEEILEHLWDVPIISSNKCDTVISTTLSTKSKEEILDILEYSIDEELGDSEAAFISFEKLAIDFSEEEKEEYLNKLENNEFEEKYNAIIIFNEPELKEQFRDLIEANDAKENPKTQEELDDMFVKYVSKIFTHERCHLNANYLVCDSKNPDLDEYVNGVLKSQSNKHGIDAALDIQNWNNRNEVLIDTLSRMIHEYEDGDKVEDCLYKVIQSRNGKSQYNDFDDKLVLAMYSIFTNELTEWTMFGAYEQARFNLLEQKIKEVFGADGFFGDKQLVSDIGKYCNGLEEGKLSDKQKDMLNMLGIDNIEKEITEKNLKNTASSEIAMSNLRGGLLDINTFIKNLSREDKDINCR